MKKLFYLFVLLVAFASPHVTNAQLCIPSVTGGCGNDDYMDSFRISGGITNTAFLPAGCFSMTSPGYLYNTGVPFDTTTAVIGSTLTFDIYNQQSGSLQQSEQYALWVDFNNDGDFNDPGEEVYQAQIAGGSSDNGSFVVPTNATAGLTRMRLACIYTFGSAATIDACNTQTTTYNNGEYVDFDFFIIGCNGQPTAPGISSAPLTGPVCYGSTININATNTNPSSSGGILFHWQSSPDSLNWDYVSGGSGAYTLNYTTAPITATTYYRLIDSCIGSGLIDTSAVYKVMLNTATSTISQQPQSALICPGNTGQFTVQASAGVPINYQWQSSSGGGPFTNITTGPYSGASTNSLTVGPVSTLLHGTLYRCVLTGTCLIPVITNIDTLFVVPTVINQQPPAAVNTCVGGNLNISVNASAWNISYQWQVDTGAGFFNVADAGVYSGSSTNTLTITNAYSGLNGRHYRLMVNGGCGSISSSVANLTIGPPLTTAIAVGPTTLCPGLTATLKANITGGATSYQWKLNNVPIVGAVDSFYIASVAGAYTAFVTNSQNCSNTSNSVSVAYFAPLNASISVNGLLRFCQGGSVTLSAATINPGVTYTWKQNGIFISGATSASYTATTSGNYSLIEFDGNCYSSSAPVTVIVDTIPVPTISQPGLTYFCAGDTVILQASPSSGATYQWMDNTVNIGGAYNATYSVVASGSYTVKVMDSHGCMATSPTSTLTSTPPPTATISHTTSTTFCSGGSITLSANTGSNYTYQWLQNNVAIPGANSITYSATTSGNYSVTVTGNVTSGCSTTSTYTTVTVNPTPAAPISAASATDFCDGSTVVLSTNAVAGQNQQWYKNGNIIQGANNPYYTATQSGTYSVVNSLGTCYAISSTINVNVTPVPVDTITVYGPPLICSGNSYLLQANIGTGYTYQWLRNGISIPGANFFTYTATSGGQYSVAITANGCVAYATPINVMEVVAPSPVASFGVTQTGVQLSVPATFVTYQWYLNNLLIAGATYSTYVPLQIGNYSCIVTDVNGCYGKSNDIPVYDITSVNKVNAGNENVRIYPNPATSVINIDAGINVNVSVYSIQGTVVLHKDNAHTLDISQLANGIYMVRVFDENNNLLKVDRLVKSEQ